MRPKPCELCDSTFHPRDEWDGLCRACRGQVFDDAPQRRELVWFNANPAWAELKENADAIRADHDAKLGSKGKVVGTYTRRDSDLVGLVGEWTYGRHFGIPWKYKWNPGGDGGMDFPGVEVKTRSSGTTPSMLVRADSKIRAWKYALVVVDMTWRHAAVWGITNRDHVQRSPKLRIRPEWPENYAVPMHQIPPAPPPTLTAGPPCVKSNGEPCVFETFVRGAG